MARGIYLCLKKKERIKIYGHVRVHTRARVQRVGWSAMASNLRTLNDALFRELERLEACESQEELQDECRRAKAVSSLAGNIIANANTAIAAANLGVGMAESVRVRDMLLESPKAPEEVDDGAAE